LGILEWQKLITFLENKKWKLEKKMIDNFAKLAGCKESQFYSLPFG